MSKIIRLTKEIYNRIAAGEVVERPFSVVKELVENSIDAGAKDITIRLEDGGKKLISVKDDGCGIEKDDLVNATMPHATSKIQSADDLDKIVTLGFRGEALASIASVSEMTITSKVKGAEIGYYIESKFGVLGDVEPFPTDNGTTIEVKNLFQNTPAREKFLKPSKTEETDIINIITRLIFSHPEISFKLFIDGNERVHYSGGKIEEAIITTYGYETIADCIHIETEKNGVKISGFIGADYFVKPNRTYQTIILNGRYVQNVTLQTAIHNAYAPYLMKRKYPFYVLMLEVAPEFVDVNVHPNKADVRFIDNHVIYSALYSTVSKVLEGNADAVNIVKRDKNFNPDLKSGSAYLPEKKEPSEGSLMRIVPEGMELPQETIDYIKFADKVLSGEYFPSLGKSDSMHFKKKSAKSTEDAVSIDDIFADNKKYITELEEKKKEENVQQTKIIVNSGFTVIGQVLKTYLILEKDGDIYFVDQHAAHERCLYDCLVEDYTNDQVIVQELLVPFYYPVNVKETDYIRSRYKDFYKIGIDISEYYEGMFVIYTIPNMLMDIDLKEFMDDFLSDSSLRKPDLMPEIIREKLARKACKAAVKSGTPLTHFEITKLLDDLNGNIGLKCPHGRPIAIKITRTEIDKWFKRIV